MLRPPADAQRAIVATLPAATGMTAYLVDARPFRRSAGIP
jgi:hypothetical protein